MEKILICDPDKASLDNLVQSLSAYDIVAAQTGQDCLSAGPLTAAFISPAVQDIMWNNLVSVLVQQDVPVYLMGKAELELLQSLLAIGGRGIVAPEADEVEKAIKRYSKNGLPVPEKKRPLRGRLERTTTRPVIKEEFTPTRQDTMLHNSKLVVFYGFKGGTGKSIISASTAVALANNRSRRLSVCVVDFDPYNGGIADIFNVRPSCSVLDWLARDGEDLKDYLIDHPSGVKILPGPYNPLDGLAINREEAKKILSVLTRRFDVVVVDTTHVPRDPIIIALENATHVFMLSLPNRVTLKNTAKIAQTLQRAQVDTSGFRLVINMMPKKAPLRLSDYKDYLPWNIDLILPADPAIDRIVNAGGLPVLDRRSKAFNQAIMQIVNIIEPQPIERKKFALPWLLRERGVN